MRLIVTRKMKNGGGELVALVQCESLVFGSRCPEVSDKTVVEICSFWEPNSRSAWWSGCSRVSLLFKKNLMRISSLLHLR